MRKPSAYHDDKALYQELLAHNTAVMTAVSVCGLLCPDEMFPEVYEVRDQVIKTMDKVIETDRDDYLHPVQSAINQLINTSRRHLNG
ncbi:hypothetical protein [Kineococcus glutinatus]|uniref:hypothetical protein n=1 Tax=Kineococcus glutinatus TaxID=1070872 RepID=UPI0031EF3376